MTLHTPGDVIITGTPPGVGLGMKPKPKFLKVGDTMEVSIQGLGVSETEGQTGQIVFLPVKIYPCVDFLHRHTDVGQP